MFGFSKKVITNENKEWISSLPLYIHNHVRSMVHGGWMNPIDEYLPFEHEYFEKMPNGIYFSGHSHIQQIYRTKGILYCNPGSVGQPRDGDWRAAFAIFDGKILNCIVFHMMWIELEN